MAMYLICGRMVAWALIAYQRFSPMKTFLKPSSREGTTIVSTGRPLVFLCPSLIAQTLLEVRKDASDATNVGYQCSFPASVARAGGQGSRIHAEERSLNQGENGPAVTALLALSG